jgi:hypothetical protein
MGLLGFGLGMLGKAVIKEAIVQGLAKQQEEERKKDLRLSKYRSMTNKQLTEIFFENMFSHIDDDFYKNPEADKISEALEERLSSRKISGEEINQYWFDYFDEHEFELYDIYYDNHAANGEFPSYSDFLEMKYGLDFSGAK